MKTREREQVGTLDHFFYPRAVAVIGVTDNPMKGGYHILRNTLAGYKGAVYPVNPKYAEVLGVPCYPDIASVPGEFDLAVYFIPARFLPETIRECAKKGARGIIIESAGFSEAGEEGKRLQEESVALARGLGVRLWGPNCMGLLDGHSRTVFSFMYTDKWQTVMKPGNVSLIVQSGMLSAGFLMMILERGGMGMSKICSIGNKCDVNETELLEYLVADGHTGVIGAYLESIVEGRRFLEAARATDKPIVVLKAGRSPMGAKAAMSHTASLSGEEAVYRGAFRQAGVVPANDVQELMDLLRGFSKTDRCGCDGGTAVVTFSGGAGIVTADLLADSGLGLAELSGETVTALKEVYPAWMEPANPVDLWPAVEQRGLEPVYLKATEALMRDPRVDSVLVHTISWDLATPDYLVKMGELKQRYGKPMAVWMIGGSAALGKFRGIAEDAGLPVFAEIGRCVAFLAGVKAH